MGGYKIILSVGGFFLKIENFVDLIPQVFEKQVKKANFGQILKKNVTKNVFFFSGLRYPSKLK